jgi:hypothetical protein
MLPNLLPTSFLTRLLTASYFISLNWLLAGLGILGLASCHSAAPSLAPAIKGTVYYLQSNFGDPRTNQVGAYLQRTDGRLQELASSPFNTLGQGNSNRNLTPGQEETDGSLALSEDHRFLFAVNQGNHTISAFTIQPDATLALVAGSPFPAGGSRPCSLAVVGSFLYVANKGEYATYTSPITADPSSYSVLAIGSGGQLTPVPAATVTTTLGALPTQVYVAPVGRHVLFAADFRAFQAPTPSGTLRAFTLGAQGQLTPVPGTPLALPLLAPATQAGGALGLWGHPTQPLLYVGMPVQGQIGVFRYDATTGRLTFVQAVAACNTGTGAAAGYVRQLRTNQTGTRLYALDSALGLVLVYDITQPQAPVFLQQVLLRDAGSLLTKPALVGTGSHLQREALAHDLALSADEQTLFVTCANADLSLGASHGYSSVHALHVQADGTLTESVVPLDAFFLTANSLYTQPMGGISLTF